MRSISYNAHSTIYSISAVRDEEVCLQQALLSTYNKAIRPPGFVVHVSVNLRFFTLLFMEQQEENMVFSGDFEMIAKFPFDQQLCKVKFSSWVYTEDELAVSAPLQDLNLADGEYQGNSEWEVTSVTVSTHLHTDPDNRTFQELHYSIKLKRHSTYYIYVLFLPTFITTALCLVGLFTPFDNAGNRTERTTLGLTTLLSLAVILNIIGDDMPKSSTLPHLGESKKFNINVSPYISFT
ncbi:hypothetical protein TELCIR_02266 [Teladorsagia circumcincta]|uniref:Neurotransmitter-gated ion-channel ligand-binding domain-containing protein n=1 Tax=Teladorsagia circumcincta TaxID=45464 RepID=A0A2G9V132_TELCI|nr:hypothetical protein TELCIR_02266 [Teladorsagia circumcincta]